MAYFLRALICEVEGNWLYSRYNTRVLKLLKEKVLPLP